MPGQALYIHARALPVYGGSPLPQNGHADFCVGNESFVIATAQTCNRTGQRMARFTAVKPTQTDKGLAAYLAEDAEYTDEQARDAGIQRLLVIAGYDANPIDGIRAGLRRVELREWRGSAADAFRDRLEEWVTTLHRRRDALDEAADLVAEHRRAAADRVELIEDRSMFMTRTEVRCASCGSSTRCSSSRGSRRAVRRRATRRPTSPPTRGTSWSTSRSAPL